MNNKTGKNKADNKNININWKELFDQTVQFIAILDKYGKLLYVNNSALDFIGKNISSVAGKFFWNTPWWSHSKELQRKLKDSIKKASKGQVVRFEAVHFSKDNNAYDFDFSLKPKYDKNGCIVFLIAEGRNISDFKSIEKRLKDRQKKISQLSTAVEQSPSIIVITNLDGNIVYTNPKFSEITGYLREEVIGKNPRILKSGETSDREYKELWKTITSGKSWRGDFHNKKKNEELYWEAASISPIFDKIGNIINYLKVAEDISIRKNFEQELEKCVKERTKELVESEKKFRGVFENAPFGMAILNINGVPMESNKSLSKMVGYNKEELKKLTFKDFTHPEDAEKDWYLFSKLVKGEIKSYDMEKRYIHKKGDIVWGSLAVNAVRDSKKKPYLIIGMVEDITNIKKLENKLKKSYQIEKTLVREIHHRVKNNLQLIISMMRLQSRRIKNKDIKEIFNESQNRIKTISLIHEKLYRSRDVTNVNLQEYASFLLNHLMSTYDVNQKRIKANVDVEQFYLSVDDLNVCGLILNELISNSLKYAFPKNKKGKIDIVCRENDEKSHKLVVSDNGVGMPKDFDIKNVKTLGYEIIKTLVKQTGGSIKIESKNGTKITVKLKRK